MNRIFNFLIWKPKGEETVPKDGGFLGFQGLAALLAPKANLTIASAVWYYRPLPSGEIRRFGLFHNPQTKNFTIIYTIEGAPTCTSLDIDRQGNVFNFNDKEPRLDYPDSEGNEEQLFQHDQGIVGNRVEHEEFSPPSISSGEAGCSVDHAQKEGGRIVNELVEFGKRDQKHPFWGNKPNPDGWVR